jgi:hypothetical protein
MRLAGSGNVGRTGAGFPRGWHMVPFFGNPLDATANAAGKAASHRCPRCWSLAGTLSGVCKQVIRRTCDERPSRIAGKWAALWSLRCLTRGLGQVPRSVRRRTPPAHLGLGDPTQSRTRFPSPFLNQTRRRAAELRPCRRPSNNNNNKNKRDASLLPRSTRAASANRGHPGQPERGWNRWMLRFGAE